MDMTYIIEQLTALANRYAPDLDEEFIVKAVGISSLKTYAKGELMTRAGDKTSAAGLVISGVVRSYYIDRDGNDITQFIAGPGSLCLDSGMFGFDEMTATWESVSGSTIMIFDVAKIKDLIFSDAGYMKFWTDMLESGMRYKIYRENGFLVENATERYLHFKKNYPALVGLVPLKHLATYLGITPESLSRIRRTLKEQDDRPDITIC